ncbi:MAG: F0F1 ATP synthase subunit B [Ichthyobacteriaceae bacterium]|nr:F0F1 ATP synthase subunit B [Ichthyobacteriaceae bacterium]
MEKLFADFSLGLFVFQSAIFVGLILLLKKYAWIPILDAVNEREEGIKSSLESADKAKEEILQLQLDNKKILKEARIERDSMMKEAREMKDKIINEARNEAQDEASKLKEIAKADIKHETMAAMTDLKNQIADLSIDIAEKILRSELKDKESHNALIDELISEGEDKFTQKQN